MALSRREPFDGGQCDLESPLDGLELAGPARTGRDVAHAAGLPSALRGPIARLGKPQHRRGVLGRVLMVNQREHNAHGDLRLAIELATALA